MACVLVSRGIIVCLTCLQAEIRSGKGRCWMQSSSALWLVRVPQCAGFSLAMFVLCYNSAQQPDSSGSRSLVGWSTSCEQEHAGKLSSVALVSPLFPGWHDSRMSLPHSLNSTLEKRGDHSVCVQNSFPAIKTWLSFIMRCLASWPDSLPRWLKEGELFCFVQCLTICLASDMGIWRIWSSSCGLS